MSNTIATSIDVRARAQLLGMEPLSDFCLLPEDFGSAANSTELTHAASASTVRKLLAERGVEVQLLSPPIPIRTRVFKSADWAAPTIFIGAQLWSQNPLAVQLALKILQSYVVGLLKARLTHSQVKLSFVVETSHSRRYRQLTYEGPPSGISEIAQTLRDMSNE